MIYAQPLTSRLGTDLIAQLESGRWTALDVGVAWVRKSGMAHLRAPIASFLARGGRARFVVGVSLGNTTSEGLRALLQLEADGSLVTFVHHNEAGPVFHPKIYILRNENDGLLIVGSNNLTESGLYRNTEAGVQLTVGAKSDTVASALAAVDSWSDEGSGLSLRLTEELIVNLLQNGYIEGEADLRAKAAAKRAERKAKKAGKEKLFGSAPAGAPKISAKAEPPTQQHSPAKATTQSHIAPPPQTGKALLMRLRKARGTQVQLPIRLTKLPFFSGVTSVYSVTAKVDRGIHETHPLVKGKPSTRPNTLKIEMPETKSMNNPVARFEHTKHGLQYEVFDASSVQGKAIENSLLAGLKSQPTATAIAVPGNPGKSTWWRFI